MAQLNYSDMSDRDIVSAVNSCIDFQKLRELGGQVTDRFKELLCHNRIKAVCFFRDCGFGLRVYEEPSDIQISGDECEPGEGTGLVFRVALHGNWMRCPPSIYEEKLKGAKEHYVIMDEEGRRYLYEYSDEDEIDEEDDGDGTNYKWVGLRGRATVYVGKEMAKQAIGRLDCVVCPSENWLIVKKG